MIAFRMGVNRPDVGFVFQVDPPPSLDAYHEEIGRAGRDGAADARLLYPEKRREQHRSFHLSRVELVQG